MRSPADNNMSSSRWSGSFETAFAFSRSSSVVSPIAETTTTSPVLSRSKDGGPPVEDHTSFDEWRAIRADSQRAPLSMEFRSADLTGLNTNATELDLYAERPATGRRILASLEITRVTNPPDDDGDGIQNACDACPDQGHPPGGYRLPNGCPP